MNIYLFVLTFSFGFVVIYYRGVCKKQNLTINSYVKKLARQESITRNEKEKYDNIREALHYLIDERK